MSRCEVHSLAHIVPAGCPCCCQTIDGTTSDPSFSVVPVGGRSVLPTNPHFHLVLHAGPVSLADQEAPCCRHAGLKDFFRRLFDTLSPGGVLVLEPQPWSSYKQAVRKQDMTAAPYHQLWKLQFRPHMFAKHLTENVGFELVKARGASRCAAWASPSPGRGIRTGWHGGHGTKGVTRGTDPSPPIRYAGDAP